MTKQRDPWNKSHTLQLLAIITSLFGVMFGAGAAYLNINKEVRCDIFRSFPVIGTGCETQKSPSPTPVVTPDNENSKQNAPISKIPQKTPEREIIQNSRKKITPQDLGLPLTAPDIDTPALGSAEYYVSDTSSCSQPKENIVTVGNYSG